MSNVNSDRLRGNSDKEMLIWSESPRVATNGIIYFGLNGALTP
jgi:hypothetical protein